MSKLVVLRGNSGSGKSSVAQKLQERSRRKLAWVEQDHIRKRVFREEDGGDGVHIMLISHITELALERGYDVVLEGILKFARYSDMLEALAKRHSEHYFFYFDIPFDETLRRHSTKKEANEFGEKEMSQWYKHHDITGFDGEIVIGPELSEEETIDLILKTTGL